MTAANTAAMTAGEPSRATALRRITRLAVLVAASLAIAKAVAWSFSGSPALLASATDSALDLLASGLNAWAFAHALAPADANHRFGHGKLESLAGLAQALLIVVSAALVAHHAWQRLAAPAAAPASALAIAVLVGATAATLALVRAQRRVAAASGSRLVAADALHYGGDVAMNIAALVGVAGSAWAGLHWLDPVMGLLIAAVIAWSAAQVARSAVEDLLDTEADAATRARVFDVVGADPDALGVHDLRTRLVGGALHANLHVVVDGDLTVREAHVVAERIEAALGAAFAGGDFVIHLDPDDHVPEDPYGDAVSLASGAPATALPPPAPDPARSDGR